MIEDLKRQWRELSFTQQFLVVAAAIAVLSVGAGWLIRTLAEKSHDENYSATQTELKATEEKQKSEADQNLGAARELHNQTIRLESEQLPAAQKRREKAESEAKTARLNSDEKRKIYEKNRNRAADVSDINGAVPSDSDLRAVAAEAGINLDDFK